MQHRTYDTARRYLCMHFLLITHGVVILVKLCGSLDQTPYDESGAFRILLKFFPTMWSESRGQAEYEFYLLY